MATDFAVNPSNTHTKVDDNVVGLTEHHVDVDADLDRELLSIGHQVIAKQKNDGFKAAIRKHWKAAGWSLFISTALWMEGFDTSMLGSFVGYPAFKDRFGTEIVNGVNTIPNQTIVALGSTGTCGQLVGLVITGWAQERFGSRKTFFVGMCSLICTLFIAVFAQNLAMIYVAQFANGIPWGMFQTLTTAYAAEICPINLRGYLAAWAQVSWSGGHLFSTGVLRACLNIEGDWAWRLPYALQWIWPVPLATFVLFAPESPWWLVRHGKFEEAKRIVTRIAQPGFYGPGEAEGFVEYMKHTDALDKAERANGNFFDLFRGNNLRRTECQVGAWVTQIFCGSAITALAVLFFQKAGMSVEFSFNMSIILTGISIFGVFLSWILIRFVGRRTLYLAGLFIIAGCNFIIATLGFTKSDGPALGVIAAFMVIIQFTFCATLGPVCYIIVGELPASRLRAQSIVLGRFMYVVIVIIVGTFNPYITNDWGPKGGYFWMGTGLACCTWCYFRLPETKGRSFAEIDLLFANKVPARQFASYRIVEQEEVYEKAVADNRTAMNQEEKQEVAHLEH